MSETLFKHYRGNTYRLLNYANHSETGEHLVIYQSVVNDQIWARPFEMFTDYVVIDGVKVRRFDPLQ